MDQTPFQLPPSHEPVPPPAPWWKRLLGPIVGVLAVGAKFLGQIKFFILPALKFLPVMLKWTRVPLQGLVDGLKSAKLRGAFGIMLGDAMGDFPGRSR